MFDLSGKVALGTGSSQVVLGSVFLGPSATTAEHAPADILCGSGEVACGSGHVLTIDGRLVTH